MGGASGSFQIGGLGSYQRPSRKKTRGGSLLETALTGLLRRADSGLGLSYVTLDYLSQRPPDFLRDRLTTQTVRHGLLKLSASLDSLDDLSDTLGWLTFCERVVTGLRVLEAARSADEALYYGDLIFQEVRAFPATQRTLGNTLLWHNRLVNDAVVRRNLWDTEGGPPEWAPGGAAPMDDPLTKVRAVSAEIENKLYRRIETIRSQGYAWPSLPGAGMPDFDDEEEDTMTGGPPPGSAPQPWPSAAQSAAPGGAPAVESPAPQPPRYANYRLFEQRDSGLRGNELSESQPLRMGKKYQLELAVGQSPQGLKTEEPRGPLPEPKQKNDVDILVTIEADENDFAIPEPVQKLVLPPSGPTRPGESAVFCDVTPQRQANASNPLSMRIRLYYEYNLLEVVRITAVAVGSQDAADNSTAGTESAVTLHQERVEQAYADFDMVQPRSMHIEIEHTDLGYRLTFALRKDKSGEEEEEGRLLALCGYVRVPEADLESALLAVRKLLLGLTMWDCDSTRIGCTDREKFDHGVEELMRLGKTLWNKIFRYDTHSSLYVVGDWLLKHPLRPGAIIQVSQGRGSEQFVFPWNFLYDGEQPGAGDQAKFLGFWGLRYSIEQRIPHNPALPDEPLGHGNPLQVALLRWRFSEASNQEALLKTLAASSHGRIAEPAVIDDCSKALELLEAGAVHLIHFFSHGHTQLANASHYGSTVDDLIEYYKALPADSPERKGLQDWYDEIIDKQYRSDESWIKLTHGMLLLNDLYGGRIRLGGRPMVFLNMCESAQVTPSLAQSFIQFFINRGASTVVGTECSMRPLFAHLFATQFLNRWMEGSNAGEALLKARLEFIRQGNPLGLAYTLFGAATARVEPAPIEVTVLEAGTAG